MEDVQEVVSPEQTNAATTSNVAEDYTKTVRESATITRVRYIGDEDNIEYVVLFIDVELPTFKNGVLMHQKEVLMRPYFLTQQLCECEPLIGMLTSTVGTLNAKQFGRLAGSRCKFERRYKHAGDTYLDYEGQEQVVAEDGFVRDLVDITLHNLGRQFLMNDLA